MHRVLVDVDTQHDFIHRDGALYVAADASVLDRIEATLQAADGDAGPYAAVVGSVDSHAFDAWEFEERGGPFPPHCVKGQRGWMRHFPELPRRQRFVPMTHGGPDEVRLSVGEATRGEGNRVFSPDDLAREALDGVGLYFEKEVYSLFTNDAAAPVLAALVARLGGPANVRFEVIGYCTGGFCVDEAARGLAARGYEVAVLADATAAIGGAEGQAKSRADLTPLGVRWEASA